MSLEDVVNAMSKETNNATLGWDVVVNYTASEINFLLAAAYNEGGEHQLMEINVSLDLDDPNADDDDTVHVDYNFKVGPPLIQFDNSAIVPACGLYLPVIGGTVKRANKEPKIISPGVYRLHLTGIALASVEGNQDSRIPKPSNERFAFTSPDTTGVVTLDLITSASKDWLKVQLHGKDVRLIDNNVGNLEKKILVFFKDSSIHWDLAQVNNISPSSSDSATPLVPEFFRFATYSPPKVSEYSMLSLFIHVYGRSHGGTEDELQSHWTSQWSDYKVPPIPHSYTASIILNNALVKDEIEKAFKEKGMPIREISKTADDNSSLKWQILTHKKYDVKRVSHTADHWPYSVYGVEGVSLNLDTQAEGLFLSIGQNDKAVANALLNWHFGFTTNWLWIHGATGDLKSGTVTVTNRLDKVKYFDNKALPSYVVRLDASFQNGEWVFHRDFTNEVWHKVASAVNYDGLSRDALPDPPSLNLEILNLDFLMTTNLLLPYSTVIKFKTKPGVRFPRDLYLVGHVQGEILLRKQKWSFED